MVQEFQVLRCYSCQTFQGQQVSKELSFKAPKEQAPAEGPAEGSASPQVFVSQVKKTNRWRCAVCGEKQSVMKVLKVWTVRADNVGYGRVGTAVEDVLWRPTLSRHTYDMSHSWLMWKLLVK